MRWNLCSLNSLNPVKTWKWLVIFSCMHTGNPLQLPTSFSTLCSSAGLIKQLCVYLSAVILKTHCLWSVQCSSPSPCPQWLHYMHVCSVHTGLGDCHNLKNQLVFGILRLLSWCLLYGTYRDKIKLQYLRGVNRTMWSDNSSQLSEDREFQHTLTMTLTTKLSVNYLWVYGI